MRDFKTMGNDLVFKIGALALENITNFDMVFSALKGQRDLDYGLLIQRELYDEKENLMVIRVRIEGMPGCYCSMWEEDLNVDTYQDEEIVETANQVKIFKLLQSEGYI